MNRTKLSGCAALALAFAIGATGVVFGQSVIDTRARPLSEAPLSGIGVTYDSTRAPMPGAPNLANSRVPIKTNPAGLPASGEDYLPDVALTGIPGYISDVSTAGATALLSFSPDGTFRTSKNPTMSGRWLTTTSGRDYELQAIATTTYPLESRCSDGPGNLGCAPSTTTRTETTTSSWLSLGSSVDIMLPDSSCRGGGIAGGPNMDVSSAVTIVIRSAADHTRSVSFDISMKACGRCFTADTQIRLADGSAATLADLTQGMKVASFVDKVDRNAFVQGQLETWSKRFADLAMTPGTVTNTHHFTRAGGVVVDGLRSTSRHVYLSDQNGLHWRGADALTLADSLVGIDGTAIPITSLGTFREKADFVAVTVDTGTFMVRANEHSPWVLVHNLSANMGYDMSPFSPQQ